MIRAPSRAKQTLFRHEQAMVKVSISTLFRKLLPLTFLAHHTLFAAMVSFKLATLAVAAFSAVNVLAQDNVKVCKLPKCTSPASHGSDAMRTG